MGTSEFSNAKMTVISIYEAWNISWRYVFNDFHDYRHYRHFIFHAWYEIPDSEISLSRNTKMSSRAILQVFESVN